jgi:hypothetical protein
VDWNVNVCVILFQVVPVGHWIPRSFFGRLVALFAYVKMTLVALYVSILGVRRSLRHEVVICDQVRYYTYIVLKGLFARKDDEVKG